MPKTSAKGRSKSSAAKVKRARLPAGCGHEFESWFQSSSAFENLVKLGQVACPACGSTQVEKALMAPSIKTKKGKEIAVPATTEPGAATKGAGPSRRQLAALTPQQRAFVETMRKMREHVLANSENVGPRFAEEARKMHYEETEARSIHGEASLDEAKSLAEEGIDVFPIPELPDDRN